MNCLAMEVTADIGGLIAASVGVVLPIIGFIVFVVRKCNCIDSKLQDLEAWKANWINLCGERRNNCQERINDIEQDRKDLLRRMVAVETIVERMSKDVQQILEIMTNGKKS